MLGIINRDRDNNSYMMITTIITVNRYNLLIVYKIIKKIKVLLRLILIFNKYKLHQNLIGLIIIIRAS